MGYDSIWVGDWLLARPRHEPLTLLAGVAARTCRVAPGTAVLLPALGNPVPRFAGEPERHLETLAALRNAQGGNSSFG